MSVVVLCVQKFAKDSLIILVIHKGDEDESFSKTESKEKTIL